MGIGPPRKPPASDSTDHARRDRQVRRLAAVVAAEVSRDPNFAVPARPNPPASARSRQVFRYYRGLGCGADRRQAAE